MTKLNQQITLREGRKLYFNEYGPANGTPLFYFHGSPSARIEFNLFGSEALLESLNIRMIAPDRPGSGLSDFQPNRRFMDWPKDVVALANHLKLERFAILGYSGGGPYAASCALAIPDRITRVGIVSGTAPFTEPGLADGINKNSRNFMDLSHQKPWLSRMILRSMGLMTRLAPNKIISNALTALPEADRAVVALPEVQQGFLAMIQEALRKGPRGAQYDTRLMVTEWDFDPHDIQIPVFLWYGEADQNAPINMGRYMENAIAQSKAKYYPNDGHLSLFKRNIEEILRTLVDDTLNRR
ncbi:MAG TPA: alpha/beta hydrolase [Proteiniclasticum sp.]|nr:alpha/beta hydrolase [Proteiniclasticum sp.]